MHVPAWVTIYAYYSRMYMHGGMSTVQDASDLGA